MAEIKFFRDELNKKDHKKIKTPLLIFYYKIFFLNNKDISFHKKLEDNYKNNVEKNEFETPERYSVKNSDKTQDNET